jgi:Trypsin-like peptidase domain
MILLETYDDEGRKRGLGSGFVVSSDGTAITNYHVVRGAYRATVKFSDGTVGSVSGVASYDQNRDLAVIRVTPSPKTVLDIGDSDKVQVGDKVVAIGSPLGLQNTMSVGIVSGLRNGLIQMSDPISPGSSGGAVFDEHGKVVAVAVSQMIAGQNLNFALPINWAKPYLNGQSPRPLSDVAAENAVTENLMDGSVTVQQAQTRSWNIVFNPNKMSNAEVHGQVSSAGGMDGKITLALYFQRQPIFTCWERACEIHQAIVSPGIYTLVLDNLRSPIFPRTVTGRISLRYVK